MIEETASFFPETTYLHVCVKLQQWLMGKTENQIRCRAWTGRCWVWQVQSVNNPLENNVVLQKIADSAKWSVALGHFPPVELFDGHPGVAFEKHIRHFWIPTSRFKILSKAVELFATSAREATQKDITESRFPLFFISFICPAQRSNDRLGTRQN